MRFGWILVLGACNRYESILALDGDVVQGEILYANNCASCHGEDGSGGAAEALTGDTLKNLTGTQVLQAIDDGPGNMPEYRGQFSKQEMADLYDFMTLTFE